MNWKTADEHIMHDSTITDCECGFHFGCQLILEFTSKTQLHLHSLHGKNAKHFLEFSHWNKLVIRLHCFWRCMYIRMFDKRLMYCVAKRQWFVAKSQKIGNKFFWRTPEDVINISQFYLVFHTNYDKFWETMEYRSIVWSNFCAHIEDIEELIDSTPM